MINIASAIQALNQDNNNSHEFVIYGKPTTETEYQQNVKYVSGVDDSGSAIFSDTQPYTWQQVSTKQAELQADYDAKQYQRDRAKEYPSMADQLDDIFHNGIDGWKTSIQAIKDKYPKE
jgi:hypothetical protein